MKYIGICDKTDYLTGFWLLPSVSTLDHYQPVMGSRIDTSGENQNAVEYSVII